MPTVQSRLVEKGVTFANGFVTNPLCCPSRASILTGSYSHRTRVYRNRDLLGGFKILTVVIGHIVITLPYTILVLVPRLVEIDVSLEDFRGRVDVRVGVEDLKSRSHETPLPIISPLVSPRGARLNSHCHHLSLSRSSS